MEVSALTDAGPVMPGKLESPKLFNPNAPSQQISVRDLFGPKFEGALIELDFALNTKPTQRLIRHYFKDLSQTLAAIDRYKSFADTDSPEFMQAEGRISAQLDKARKIIAKVEREANALIVANGHADVPLKHTGTIQYRVPIIAAAAREFMEALKAADTALSQIDKCQLLGLLDYKTKNLQDQTMRKAIRSVAAVSREVRVRLLTHFKGARTNQGAEADAGLKDLAASEAKALLEQGRDDQDLLGAISAESAVQRIAADLGVTLSDRVDEAPSLEVRPAEEGDLLAANA